ncbi:MAG: D-alanyl-D-alanine carboxypeptidase family protein [Pseudomonadota bacterium]
MRPLFAFITLVLLLPVKAHALPHLTIDLDNGQVLSHSQAFDPWHPASLTKLMTAYVAFRAIETGELSLDHPVRISKAARRQPPSRMGYGVGTAMTLENALKLILIKSANDVSHAIAESISGSVDKFAARMNRDAKALGMTGSRFVNPHGLHDRRQVTTARDMAVLVQALHKRYPQYNAWFSTPSVLAPSRTKNGKMIKRIYYSYNLLLERFRGGDGFKTGFVCASGYNFIGSATQGGRRVAAIVLGRDGQTSRAVDAAKLITEGLQFPLTAGTPLAALKPTGTVLQSPRNMRPLMCTEAARAARYEPGAGQAVIRSPWLQERQVGAKPLTVRLGIPGGGLRLARVPRPTFRPAIQPTTVATLIQQASPAPKPELSQEPFPAPSSSPALAQNTNGIPLPTFRPRS